MLLARLFRFYVKFFFFMLIYVMSKFLVGLWILEVFG